MTEQADIYRTLFLFCFVEDQVKKHGKKGIAFDTLYRTIVKSRPLPYEAYTWVVDLLISFKRLRQCGAILTPNEED